MGWVCFCPLQEFLSGQPQTLFRNDLCASGVGDHCCACQLRSQVGLGNASKIFDTGIHNARAELLAMFGSATEKPLMKIPLGFACR